MSSIPATAPATDGALTHKQILTILTGLMLGMFLAALDQTIVATAIRTIGDDLHGLSAQAWVTTAFLITSTIATPLYGKLSDIYGRKPLFMMAITHLHRRIGAVWAVPESMYMLAAFRAFQGLGAGGLFSLALAIIGDMIAPPGTRALPGLLPGRLRHVERARSGHRWLLRRSAEHPRHRRMALDLLHQRPDRAHRAARRQPHPAPPRRSAAATASTGSARPR